MSNIEQLVIGSWGPIKSAKTTFGLTFPRPLVHLDFDLGFERARARIPANLQIITVPHNVPLTPLILDSGDIITKGYKLPIKFPKQKMPGGTLEIWENEIIPDIVLIMETPRILSILYDTGTVMWSIDKDAQLERAQKSAAKFGNTRETLSQIEYSVPNQEIRALLGAAKHYGKNLYIPHHIGGMYEERLTTKGTESVRTGDTWDGWSHLGAIVDVIGRTKIQTPINGQGIVTELVIETCGYTLQAEGLTVPNPTFDTVLSLINTLREAEGDKSNTAIFTQAGLNTLPN